jgi:hypothetical protein
MPPKLVFIHLGKTAGTSLIKMLARALGPNGCPKPFIQSYLTEEEARHYDTFQAICGHISRADQLKWFPEREVITVLREPIDRCLSFVHYVRSLPPESFATAADAHRLPVLEYIETGEAQRNLHNTMVRQLGGHMLDAPGDFATLLEKAKQTLQSALWVGKQDSFDADVSRLGRTLGLPLEPMRENITPMRPRREDENPALMERLYNLNRYDLELWQWAQATLWRNI